MGSAFSNSKLHTNLVAARHRVRLHKSKILNSLQHERRQICELLRSHAYDKASIRVEGSIRKQEESVVDDQLELYLELLISKCNQISSDPTLPAELAEAIYTIIWLAPRLPVDELRAVRDQLYLRYGADIGRKSTSGVNAEVRSRLEFRVPDNEAKLTALESIAAEFRVPFVRSDVKPRVSSTATTDVIREPAAAAAALPSAFSTTALLYDLPLPVQTPPDEHAVVKSSIPEFAPSACNGGGAVMASPTAGAPYRVGPALLGCDSHPPAQALAAGRDPAAGPSPLFAYPYPYPAPLAAVDFAHSPFAPYHPPPGTSDPDASCTCGTCTMGTGKLCGARGSYGVSFASGSDDDSSVDRRSNSTPEFSGGSASPAFLFGSSGAGGTARGTATDPAVAVLHANLRFGPSS